MKNKWIKTSEIFDNYEKRFAKARADKVLSRPWEDEEKKKIIASAKRMLGYDEKLVPDIHNMEEVGKTDFEGYCAIQLRYESWKKMYGASTLFLPESAEKLPLVFLCCGHGKSGRLTSSYQAMGHRLASLGIACLVMDNIGQGDRQKSEADLDHWHTTAPFQCGLTLQGLIVMETIAIIRHMQKDERFDYSRFAACGNSGGGTLTMFLAALAPELSVIASSGYPSEISYILQKERAHCACNLLIGETYEAEMWELYSVFAPKPLLLEGGNHDNLIPVDLAHRNARKVKNCYIQSDAEQNFDFKLTDTRHPWDVEDINVISEFLSKHLTGKTHDDITEMFTYEDISSMKVAIPSDCLTTAELCEKLSGAEIDENKKLQHIFVPEFEGKAINPEEIQTDVGRGDLMRVFAQFECALYNEKELK